MFGKLLLLLLALSVALQTVDSNCPPVGSRLVLYMVRGTNSTELIPGTNITTLANSTSSVWNVRCMLRGSIDYLSAILGTALVNPGWWQHNSVPIALQDPLRRTLQLGLSTGDASNLRLEVRWPEVVTEGLEGIYTCQVCNLSASFNLNVAVPAQIVYVNSSVYVPAGQATALLCVANGDRPVQIAWHRAGRKVLENQANELLLPLASPQRSNSGEYTCNVVNDFGRDSRSLTLVFQVVPVLAGTALPLLVPNSVQPRGATFSVQAPEDDGNSVTVLYLITCTPLVLYSHAAPVNATSTSLMVTVRRLHPGVQYSCVYYATNTAGQSRASLPVELRIMDGASSAPQYLEVVASFAGILTVTFQHPPQNATFGIVTRFIISYWSAESLCNSVRGGQCRPANCLLAGNRSVASNESGSEMSLELDGLCSGTEYNVSVQAVNNAGEGLPTTVSVRTNDLREFELISPSQTDLLGPSLGAGLGLLAIVILLLVVLRWRRQRTQGKATISSHTHRSSIRQATHMQQQQSQARESFAAVLNSKKRPQDAHPSRTAPLFVQHGDETNVHHIRLHGITV